ncbi:MAG: HD domain-containing protein [bacterium]
MDPSETGLAKRIADYVVGDRILAYFAVRRHSVREFARGQFVSLELGDCSGRLAAVMWEPDHFALTELSEGMVIKARGVVSEYNNRQQLTLDRLRLARLGEYQLEDIMPHSDQPLERRRGRIKALIERIENGYVRSLTDSFFDDAKFSEAYFKAAAGKLWHHAYVGGLSEHSANVAELALDVAGRYSHINKDLLIFGGLLHDAGKIEQYSIETVIDYTDSGRLVGHISLADQWLCQRAQQIEAFPDGLLAKLRHMILSHHGELAYASPVVPQIPEAFLLYYCDEIDSKMGALERIRRRRGTGWSDYVKMLDRHIYFDPQAED